MAYSTVEQIASEFKDIDFQSEGTLMPSADVELFIDQFSALIDAYIGSRYLVPVTASDASVALLNLFCSTLVADKITKILETRQQTNQEANQEVRGAFTTKMVMEQLSRIKKGELALDGATLLINSGHGSFFSNNASNNIEPVWKKEEEQW